MNAIDPDLADAVARSFCTALNLLGDPAQAEALVSDALAALNRIAAEALRDAVIRKLVQAQLSAAH